MKKNNTSRKASVNRKTKETAISIDADIDGIGNCKINSGIKFIDHLIGSFSKYSMIDFDIKVNSFDSITHHLIEDLAITLGQSLDQALGDRSGIRRYGYSMVPMDDSLSNAAVDLVKRRYLRINLSLARNKVEDVSQEVIEHFFRSFAENINACIHINAEYGTDDHHKIESAIKSFALAFRTAIEIDKKRVGIPSTKGVM